MDRWEHNSIIEANQNCQITLTLGVALGTPVVYECIPCVRTEYTQDDIDATQHMGNYTESEKHKFRFVTPEGAANPQKWDLITDEDGLIWTIIGASKGADKICRQWVAYITTPKGQGTGMSRGK